MQLLVPANPEASRTTIEHHTYHYDHLKNLAQEYRFMREAQTYARLTDPTFRTDPRLMAQSDNRSWLRTSLVVSLPYDPSSPFFVTVNEAYQAIADLIRHYYPAAGVDVYVDTAHITVKTVAEDQAQTRADLMPYHTLIQPIVAHWLALMAAATQLYALSLFSSLTKDKGLSIGIRFYPTLPLLQIIRGAVGVALYQHTPALALRPEHKFHTTLIHSTGLRARLVDFPLSDRFLQAFKGVIESYDKTVFGVITDLQAADFIIRHGYSDQLIPLAEVDCGQ